MFALISDEELSKWKCSQHPFLRSDVDLKFFEPGYDLKERLIKSGLPDILVLEEKLLFQKAEDFLWDLREIKAWEKVQVILIEKEGVEPSIKQPNVYYFKGSPNLEDYQNVIKSIGKIVSRRYPRKAVNCLASIFYMAKRIECRVKDLSLCGCRIEYSGKLPIGSIIPITFGVMLGKKGYVVKATAKVVREIKDGYGLNFISMESEDRNILNLFLRG